MHIRLASWEFYWCSILLRVARFLAQLLIGMGREMNSIVVSVDIPDGLMAVESEEKCYIMLY